MDISKPRDPFLFFCFVFFSPASPPASPATASLGDRAVVGPAASSGNAGEAAAVLEDDGLEPTSDAAERVGACGDMPGRRPYCLL